MTEKTVTSSLSLTANFHKFSLGYAATFVMLGMRGHVVLIKAILQKWSMTADKNTGNRCQLPTEAFNEMHK